MSDAELSLWCAFEAPDQADPLRKVCRQCGYVHRSSQAPDRITRECPAADAIRPPRDPVTPPVDLATAATRAIRKAFPTCPLTDEQIRGLVDRCQTCSRWAVAGSRCGRWTCSKCFRRWRDTLALGATCYRPAEGQATA